VGRGSYKELSFKGLLVTAELQKIPEAMPPIIYKYRYDYLDLMRLSLKRSVCFN